MTAAGWAALAICIFGAFSYGAGSILQAVGAQRSIGTVRTMGHPLYLIGVGCDLLAWAGSMIALRELAVYQVQAILAGSLAVTIVAARLFLGSRLRTLDIGAVAITIGALTVLAMSAGPQEQVAASTTLRFGFCAAAVLTAAIGWGATKAASPGVVAALAGLSLGAAALAGRALILPAHPLEHLGAAAIAVVTEPLSAALVVFAATGMLLYTDALQRGQVGPMTAVLWIGEVIAPSAAGLAVLGDTVRPGWELAAASAGLITVCAAVLLATAPASGGTTTPGIAFPQTALAGGHRPAALPAREYGTILWWGTPVNPLPIWRPPDRALNATAWTSAPGTEPGRPEPQPLEAATARTAIGVSAHRTAAAPRELPPGNRATPAPFAPSAPWALSTPQAPVTPPARPTRTGPVPPRRRPIEAPRAGDRQSGANPWSAPPRPKRD
jgi:drug/metabolite transporter (DMT)-like permease